MQDNFPVYDGNKQKKSVFISMYQNVQKEDRDRGRKSDFCLPEYSNPACAVLKVDKNRGKCLIFVYLTIQIRPAQTRK